VRARPERQRANGARVACYVFSHAAIAARERLVPLLRNATMFQESLRRLTVASVMDRDFVRVQAGVTRGGRSCAYRRWSL